MLYEVGGLTVGDEELCAFSGGRFDGYVVHAAKDPCHRGVCGYDTKSRLPSDHPHYLSKRVGNALVLNMIDPSTPLFSVPLFTAALDFLWEAHVMGQPAAVHCNRGASRAPSIALLHMAKRSKLLPDDSFAVARSVFETMLPPDTYQPGKGISIFLEQSWGSIS